MIFRTDDTAFVWVWHAAELGGLVTAITTVHALPDRPHLRLLLDDVLAIPTRGSNAGFQRVAGQGGANAGFERVAGQRGSALVNCQNVL